MGYLGGQSVLKAALVLENLKVQPPMPVGQDGRPGGAPHKPCALASGLCPQGVPAEAPDLRRGAGGARAEASGLRQRLGEDGDRLPADPVGAAPETGPEGAEVAGEGRGEIRKRKGFYFHWTVLKFLIMSLYTPPHHNT